MLNRLKPANKSTNAGCNDTILGYVYFRFNSQ